MSRCAECKCCEAQKDFELCVFCEDGAPCPGRKRLAKTSAGAEAVAATEIEKPAGKVRQEKKTAMSTPRLCACKPGCAEIAKSNASPYAKGHNPNLKKTTAEAVSPKRTARKAKAELSRTRKGAAKAEQPAAQGVATISVTVEHMDNFWSKLSLPEKAAIFQRQLLEGI